MIDNGEITFGDNVYIGPNCCFCTAERPLEAVLRNTGIEYAKPIKVGSNVCFGSGVTVAAGVTIGDNVVITTGSVVTKDIPSDCIASGNPCLPTKITEKSAVHEASKSTEAKPVNTTNAKTPEPATEKPRTRHLEIRRVDAPPHNNSGFPDKRR